MVKNNQNKLTEDYISEYYNKRRQLNKLEDEVKEMSDVIKNTLVSNNMYYCRVGRYSISMESCHKPNKDFIKLIKDTNYSYLISETCTRNNFDYICEKLCLDKDKYRDFQYNRLFVIKKK